jgi:hypothetical protein
MHKTRVLTLLALLSPSSLQAQVGPGQAVPVATLAASRQASTGDGVDVSVADLVLGFADSVGAGREMARELLRCREAASAGRWQMAVVIPEWPKECELPEDVLPVEDGDGEVRRAFLGQADRHRVVVVSGGRVLWRGGFAQDLPSVLRQVGESAWDCASHGHWLRVSDQLYNRFDGMPARQVVGDVQRLLEVAPGDGFAYGSWWLAEREKRVDEDAATRVLNLALEQLQDRPRPLAEFCEMVLLSKPYRRQIAERMVVPLARAAESGDHPDQLVHLRCCVMAARSRDVGRLSHKLFLRAEAVPAAALRYVETLLHDTPAAIHVDLCERMLSRIDMSSLPARQLLATRHLLRLRGHEDRTSARALLQEFLESIGGRASWNNVAWELMTDFGTRGRHDELALALVERMLEERASMDYFEFDTAAMAVFLADRADEAVELQQVAMHRGGQLNARYAERLLRYRTAAAARPR